ncbi:hypothetical protein POM88_001321 [Heracleum sosnowskyi]|uniref:tRNA(Ile)-lysidine synthetase n=1 Tax=Heracleum sosnowskyi TaxID=360622 RepID=A0AAD8NAR4_9APIA|nr:hypothetical protein POM88_001321 [Heracleum sosnowskyi]
MQGDIAVARSTDKGATWQQLGITLDEDWNLSYPYIFNYNGQVWLLGHMFPGIRLFVGIKCEIARVDWANGKRKQGHVQEAARAVRYQQFQRICNQYQMNVLLVAHHADDQ